MFNWCLLYFMCSTSSHERQRYSRRLIFHMFFLALANCSIVDYFSFRLSLFFASFLITICRLGRANACTHNDIAGNDSSNVLWRIFCSLSALILSNIFQAKNYFFDWIELESARTSIYFSFSFFFAFFCVFVLDFALCNLLAHETFALFGKLLTTTTRKKRRRIHVCLDALAQRETTQTILPFIKSFNCCRLLRGDH